MVSGGQLAGKSTQTSKVKIPVRAEISVGISAPPVPLSNSAMMSTPTPHCQWDDEMAKERAGHQPSYAKLKKMK